MSFRFGDGSDHHRRRRSGPVNNVSRRRFGNLEVAVIDVGTTHFRPWDNPVLLECDPWSWDEVCQSDGRVVLGVNVILAKTATATIVIDPCTFDAAALTAGDAVIVPGTHMDAGLEALGVKPTDVTHVLITHTHEDHFSGILGDPDGLRFPNALHVLPSADWRSIIVPGHPFAASAEKLRRRLPLSGRPGGALLVEGDHHVCEGVTLRATPGETEGHQIVRLHTAGERVYVLGDLIHWTAELEDPRRMGPTSSPTEIRRALIAEMQDQPSTLLFSHARFPGWGRLTPDGQGKWRWRFLEESDRPPTSA